MLLVFNPAQSERAPTTLPVPPHGARGPGHVAFAATADALDRWRARLEAAGVAIEADFRWPRLRRPLALRPRPRRQLRRVRRTPPLGLLTRVDKDEAKRFQDADRNCTPAESD